VIFSSDHGPHGPTDPYIGLMGQKPHGRKVGPAAEARRLVLTATIQNDSVLGGKRNRVAVQSSLGGIRAAMDLWESGTAASGCEAGNRVADQGAARRHGTCPTGLFPIGWGQYRPAFAPA